MKPHPSGPPAGRGGHKYPDESGYFFVDASTIGQVNPAAWLRSMNAFCKAPALASVAARGYSEF